MFEFLIYAAVFFTATWILTKLLLRARDHSSYDEPVIAPAGSRSKASPQIGEIHRLLDETVTALQNVPRLERVTILREVMDEGVLGAPVTPGELGVETHDVDADGVPAEWVLAPGADTDNRLLYIHGGGFIVGSPASARMLTAALSKACGAAVLSIDYRLMPENRRMDSVVDCQTAYRWMIDKGPDGPGSAKRVFVAGDSAGGSLTLMLSAWTRDEGVRRPDAVIAFSPTTDSTLEGKSLRANIDTDPMLGPPIGPFAKLPATIKVLVVLVLSRVSPRNPLVSPLLGQLDNLPPTLVQASECEMLIDDARRYVNKAVSQGTPARLQTWPGMVHVFQMFMHVLPEGREAMDNVARFVAETDKL